MALRSGLKHCEFIISLARNLVKTLAEDMVRAQKEIHDEDAMDDKEVPKKGMKEIDFRLGAQQRGPASYGKMIDTSQKEKVHEEPKQNQREVYIAI